MRGFLGPPRLTNPSPLKNAPSLSAGRHKTATAADSREVRGTPKLRVTTVDAF